MQNEANWMIVDSLYMWGFTKHVRDKECTSKDFLDAETDEFEARGRTINY